MPLGTIVGITLVDNFLTQTCDHWNNPTEALLEEVATDIAITPIDPATDAAIAAANVTQAYPNEKLYRLKQCYTKYAAFAAGDHLISGGVTYTVKTAHKYDAQGGLDTFYMLLVEELA